MRKEVVRIPDDGLNLGYNIQCMAGPHRSKFELKNARVFIHLKDTSSDATVTHIDVEHPALNTIIKPDENTFVGCKDGGVFIGLKSAMIERAETYVDEHE